MNRYYLESLELQKRKEMRDADRVTLMLNALKAIKRAAINGDICDDVAWFDQIETLHDFCDRIIDAVVSPADHP